MTIQLSVLLWTIICFCLLMLILNKMLLKPLLQVMDARQARIDGAKAKKRRDQEAYDAALLRLEEERTEEDKTRTMQAAAAVSAAREKAEAQVAEAKRKQELEIAAYAETLKNESCELKTKLDAGVDSLAAAYANRLAS